MAMRSGTAKLAAVSGFAFFLAAEPLEAAGPPPKESCAYWLSRTPAEWRSALEEARARWEAVEVTFGDVQSWRAERAKAEPRYAATVSDAYIRVTLKGQGYVEAYGPITDEEAYQYILVWQPRQAAGIRFDENGNALTAENEVRAALDRQIPIRSRYEVLRDGLTSVYFRCTDDPEAGELSRIAGAMMDQDLAKRAARRSACARILAGS
jgi:hypothetical protein